MPKKVFLVLTEYFFLVYVFVPKPQVFSVFLYVFEITSKNPCDPNPCLHGGVCESSQLSKG